METGFHLKHGRGEEGFTLVEILMAVAILIVLIALLIPNLTGGSDKRNAAIVMRTAEGIMSGLAKYKADIGAYPAALQSLWDKNAVDSSIADYWKGPYLDTPSKTNGSSPTQNVADQNIAGVTYEYKKVTSSGGGSGTCADSTAIGSNNSSGNDHTVKITAVPHETATVVRDKLGNKICLSDASGDTTDIYFIIEEAW
ncbi:MAG: hypothetical protein U0411_09625 [Thermodesulfovibrionales bacterium]